MEEILNLSTNFCEIISEKLLRDLVQCFVIEENRSCIILLYWDWSNQPGARLTQWADDRKLIISPAESTWWIEMRSLHLLSVVVLTSAQIRQFFIRQPDNQTAIEGEQVRQSVRGVILPQPADYKLFSFCNHFYGSRKLFNEFLLRLIFPPICKTPPGLCFDISPLSGDSAMPSGEQDRDHPVDQGRVWPRRHAGPLWVLQIQTHRQWRWK